MACSFIKRLLSKVKLTLQTIPENSTSVLLREILCGSCKVVLTEEEVERQMASVVTLFSLGLFLPCVAQYLNMILKWMDQVRVIIRLVRMSELCVGEHFMMNTVLFSEACKWC